MNKNKLSGLFSAGYSFTPYLFTAANLVYFPTEFEYSFDTWS